MRIQMKSILLSTIGAFALFSLISLSSCKDDKCKAVVCAYGGVCQDDGSCICPIGYEGERCETISRDKFKGTWSVTEDGTGSNPALYAVSVENGNNIDDVKIRNFNNKDNAEIMAKVVGDTIYISSQPMQVGEEVRTVVGKGYAVPEAYYGLHGKLILSYSVSSEDGSVNQYGTGGAENPSIWTK
jgi:hypothetical protein